MEFRVRFTARENTTLLRPSYAVETGNKDTGLGGVDTIRERLDMPKLDIARIDYTLRGRMDTSVSVVISEYMARDAKLYEMTNTVDVIVPPNFINDYVDYKVETRTDPKTGEVLRATLVPVINKPRLLRDWAVAHYPTEWGFNDGDNDDDDC